MCAHVFRWFSILSRYAVFSLCSFFARLSNQSVLFSMRKRKQSNNQLCMFDILAAVATDAVVAIALCYVFTHSAFGRSVGMFVCILTLSRRP